MSDKPKWTLTKKKILMMDVQGTNGSETARQLGISQVWVSNVKNSPQYLTQKRKLEKEIQEKVQTIFINDAEEAARRITVIAKRGKPEDRIRLDAAKEILYQVGCKPIEVLETRSRDYTPEEVESALIVAKELEATTERLSNKKSDFLIKKDPTSEEDPNKSDQPVLDTSGENGIPTEPS